MTLTTTIRSANDPQFDADTITATLDGIGAEIRVYVFASDIDDVPVVQIDTEPNVGRVRVVLNDGPPVWNGDPERDDSADVVLDMIAERLSGAYWSPDDLEVIAAWIRGTGRTISDVDTEDVDA